MKVLNEYTSHHYIEDYEKSKLFCPNCGKQEVWENQNNGDYYVGTDFICTSCSHTFTMPNLDLGDALKVKQLLSGITTSPSTPRGR